MATNPTPRLITAARRAQAKRDASARVADTARAAYRRAIVAALDGGVSQTGLARELNTSASRVREEAARGRMEAVR
jgi:hypothetical protein